MDGTEGERAAKSRKLAKTVELWSGLPVRMWDERQTTCAAADLLDESGTYGRPIRIISASISLATSQTRAATLLRAFKVIWGVMAVVRNSVRSQVARPVRLSP